jgi:hypothetical protein
MKVYTAAVPGTPCCLLLLLVVLGLCYTKRNSFRTINHTVAQYEGVSKSFRTGRLERELQMVQLSVSLVSFASITLCTAFQRVFIVVVYFVMTQSGNFWIHTHTLVY